MGTVCVSIYLCHLKLLLGFSGGSAIKESTCNAEDEGSIPVSRRSSGVGNDSPLQCSCLGPPTEEESGGPWHMGSQRVDTVKPLSLQKCLTDVL